LRDERVVADHRHLEAERAARDLLPDAAEAEDAERLAGELDAAEARALPAPLHECRVRLWNVAREREQQADRVLGRGDDRRFRRIGDDDPAPRRRLDVDIVDADARAPDHLEVRRECEHVGGQLRRRADDDRVVTPDDLLERRVAVDVDVEVRAQEVDARVRDRLPDEDLQTEIGSSYASSARVTATPRSSSAPSSVSVSSRAASATVMSKTSNQPMWPMRKTFPFSAPWPGASV